ncbi:MAG: hypothetical protein K9H64_04570 [Bacteroidales bacterium]|nr:hypothetical protein [Bacteroidales bacterium]MCF8455122.1 hypothetical protein [Bacteroidales bacterium]
MKNIFLISLASVLLLSACSNEMELQKSVFVSDMQFPGLPEYSEWGYNTFGGYYDREIFVSNDYEVPMKVIVKDGATTFSFNGQMGDYSYYYSSDEMSMEITLPNFSPDAFSDLITLDETVIDLKQSGCHVDFKINGYERQATIINGNLEFKRAQNLSVDKQQVEVILSGYFQFQVLVNDDPISINNGRFDVGVGPTNFFAY